MKICERAQQVHQRLLAHFGEPEWTRRPALDELILTILSQNTNDRNRDIAYETMRERFPNWEAIHHAEEEELIDAVRYAGLGNQKAPRIQAALEAVYQKAGDYSLSFLENMKPEAVMEWLVSLKGVGPKTASIVMVFSLGMPAFPVDTHIYRVSGRIGLRDSQTSVDQAHQELGALYRPEQHASAHLLLIYLGRQICKARKPQCGECPVNDLCLFDAKNVG
jgi:endonuclease-3